jgi:hypothetical protein
VIIVLSALLINGYGPHNGLGEDRHMNSLLSYGAFCGGAGLILAVVGVAAMFFDFLKGIIVLGLDAAASFFLLAGGLVSSQYWSTVQILIGPLGIRYPNQGWKLHRYRVLDRSCEAFCGGCKQVRW